MVFDWLKRWLRPAPEPERDESVREEPAGDEAVEESIRPDEYSFTLESFREMEESIGDETDRAFARGIALAGLERWEEALAAFDQAVAESPDDAESWLHRGEALPWLGRNRERAEVHRLRGNDRQAADAAEAERVANEPSTAISMHAIRLRDPRAPTGH